MGLGCRTYSHDPHFFPNLVYLLAVNAGRRKKNPILIRDREEICVDC